MELSDLSLDHFEGRIGEQFTIQPGGDGESQALTAELVEAETAGSGTPHEEGARAPFSLVFRAPSEPVLEQGTYEVGHGEMGSAPIFLVPVGQDDDGIEYQAVFG